MIAPLHSSFPGSLPVQELQKVKKIPLPVIGFCMLSWKLNPSLGLSDLILSHKYFLIIPYPLVFLAIRNWLFSKPGAGTSSSKKSPWPFISPTITSEELGAQRTPWRSSALCVHSPPEDFARAFIYFLPSRGTGTWQELLFSLRWKRNLYILFSNSI